MYFGKLNKLEIRQQALVEAIRFCGGVAAYSDRIKVNRTRASNWCNKPEITIPYEYVVLTEAVTRVSIERLSPFTERANKAIRSLRIADNLTPIEVPLNEIIVNNFLLRKCINQERPIIVGTDMVLISGLEQMESRKSIKLKKAKVTVLDLESLLLGINAIKDINFSFLISEQVAIGLRLEQLIHARLEKRSGLQHCKCGTIKHIKPYRICDEVKERYADKIAHIIGLSSKSAYHLARQVYLNGDSEVINRLDQKHISIEKAAEIVNVTKGSQYAYI